MAAREQIAGTVKRIYPAKREVRIAPATGCRAVLEQLKVLDVESHDGSRIQCRVKQARWSGDEWVVEFVPGVTRDAVGRMKRARIVTPVTDSAERNDGDFALVELEGCTIADEQGEVGVVSRTAETKGGGILEVTKTHGGMMLLPAVPELISEIDFDAKRIVVRDIERFAVEEDDESAADGSPETD